MGDKIVKSKNLCCQLVVFTRHSLLNVSGCTSQETKKKLDREVKTDVAQIQLTKFMLYNLPLNRRMVNYFFILYLDEHKMF